MINIILHLDDFVRLEHPSGVPVSIPTMTPTASTPIALTPIGSAPTGSEPTVYAPTVSAPTVSAPTVSAPTVLVPAIDINSSYAVVMSCVLEYEISLTADHFKESQSSYEIENVKEDSYKFTERRSPDLSEVASIVDADIYFIEMALHRYN